MNGRTSNNGKRVSTTNSVWSKIFRLLFCCCYLVVVLSICLPGRPVNVKKNFVESNWFIDDEGELNAMHKPPRSTHLFGLYHGWPYCFLYQKDVPTDEAQGLRSIPPYCHVKCWNLFHSTKQTWRIWALVANLSIFLLVPVIFVFCSKRLGISGLRYSVRFVFVATALVSVGLFVVVSFIENVRQDRSFVHELDEEYQGEVLFLTFQLNPLVQQVFGDNSLTENFQLPKRCRLSPELRESECLEVLMCIKKLESVTTLHFYERPAGSPVFLRQLSTNQRIRHLRIHFPDGFQRVRLYEDLSHIESIEYKNLDSEALKRMKMVLPNTQFYDGWSVNPKTDEYFPF